MKAIYQRLGVEGWGHSVKQLLDTLSERESVPDELKDAGILLDRFYILTRYPNGLPQSVPGEYFLAGDAEEAITHADSILAFVRERLCL